jgi:site-specific DNA-methyltransferase (adenine-specific)
MSTRPWLDDGDVQLYLGDCRQIMQDLPDVDCVVTDPPYGVTSLKWDRVVEGWAQRLPIRKTCSVWVFGSLRFFLADREFDGLWRFAQEIVWEKHNGSNFHADRFRRVHELAAQFYPAAAPWESIYKNPQFTMDATARTVRRKGRPPHTGHIEASAYASEDGGPRLQRSVLRVRSCHGSAVHETQKPTGILRPLIEYSCPPGGVVLDPFIGSGSTAVAAREVGRRCIGIEIDEARLEMAAQRLAQRPLSPTLESSGASE